MEFERFKSTLDAFRALDKFVDDADKIGITLIDSPIFENTATIFKNLFSSIYNDESYEWLDWYYYELPNLKKYNKDKDDVFAYDKDGKALDFTSDKDIWEFIENLNNK